MPLWEEKIASQNAFGFSDTGLTRQEVSKKHMAIYGRALPDWLLRQQYLPMLENAGLLLQEPDAKDKRRMLIYPTRELTLSEDKNNSESDGGVDVADPANREGDL
jgi:hypothetical protein